MRKSLRILHILNINFEELEHAVIALKQTNDITNDIWLTVMYTSQSNNPRNHSNNWHLRRTFMN